MDSQTVFDDQNQSNQPPHNHQEGQEVVKESIGCHQSLAPAVVQLLEDYQKGIAAGKKGENATIHVDEIASKIAKLYEKIRKVVDWKEENVLRRSAILRILKRSLLSKLSVINFAPGIDTSKVAEPLVLELIRGGHLANDEVPQPVIEVVARVISKYVYILENAPFTQNNKEFLLKKKVNFYNWILEIAACEIEEVLACPFKENALIKAMTLLMTDRIRLIPENALNPEEKKTLIYIAVCRTLFDLDDPFISYHILTHHYKSWNNPSVDFLKAITGRIFQIDQEINGVLSHPLSRQFFNICERTDTVFTLLSDLLDRYEREPEKILAAIFDQNRFKESLIGFYDKRIKSLKTRLFRLAIFSTLSVFVSNWVTFFIIEVPVAHLFYEGFNFLAAAADFVIPSIVMFILVAIIRPPAGNNLERVIEMTFRFVYQGKEKDIFEIKLRKKSRPIFRIIIWFFYLTGCCLSFGFIAWIFYIAKIPITSVIFDTMQIALNVFAALVIRNKARELTVSDRPTFGEFILDILSVPVAEVGAFLANKWREYNIVTVFFNFLIEVPFISLVEFVDNWNQYLKEKKADIH